jgi:Amt family ammonium transporter
MVRTIGALIERLAAQEHRMQEMHSVTGLPTRERLAARMAADGSGTLAILACRDYDRLCAFDVHLAEGMLKQIVERISAMVPPSHLVAQVDRSHLAIWIGPEMMQSMAEAEIDALCYALGERIVEGDREILPEILSRKARFDAVQAPPQSTISRTLSTFSVPSVNNPQANVASFNLEAQARERFQVEQDLRQAVVRNQFKMQYQPLIDAELGQVCGAEALLRWHHPQRGEVSPARFLPIAETAGLSHEIGLWTLNRATRDAREWQLGGSAMRVAVNVTGHQLDARDLTLLISRTLERHALPAELLEIELTEGVALADDARAPLLCNELRAQGIQIAIDDFGTGYSSLSALRNLRFDKLKIDRTFVTGVHRRHDSQAICSSLFHLGRGLGIKVLAEGVETAEEYRWLRSHGCQFFQGFLFSAALDSEELLAFARAPLVLPSIEGREIHRTKRLYA